MNDEKIISSLKVKKLFGEYDVDIEFKKITVLVGKNGLGKTTLLKIIQELMTGNEHFNFEELTKGIILKFSDGNVISHGNSDGSFNNIELNFLTILLTRLLWMKIWLRIFLITSTAIQIQKITQQKGQPSKR